MTGEVRLVPLDAGQIERLQQVNGMLARMAEIGGAGPELTAFGSTLETIVTAYESAATARQMDELLHTADTAYKNFGPNGAPESRRIIAKFRAELNPAPPDEED